MIQKILEKKPVYTALLFTVNEMQIEVKPDVVHTHHNVERQASVLILPITEENEVYLVQQYRYNQGREVLECVAGYIDANEDPLVAAKRELREETGLSATEWLPIPLLEIGASSYQGKIYSYIAKGLISGETDFDEAEDIQTVKLPLRNAMKKVMDGEINMVSSVSLLFFGEKLLREGAL